MGLWGPTPKDCSILGSSPSTGTKRFFPRRAMVLRLAAAAAGGLVSKRWPGGVRRRGAPRADPSPAAVSRYQLLGDLPRASQIPLGDLPRASQIPLSYRGFINRGRGGRGAAMNKSLGCLVATGLLSSSVSLAGPAVRTDFGMCVSHSPSACWNREPHMAIPAHPLPPATACTEYMWAIAPRPWRKRTWAFLMLNRRSGHCVLLRRVRFRTWIPRQMSTRRPTAHLGKAAIVCW